MQSPSTPTVESVMGVLVSSINKLIESLTLWSQLQIDEDQVSQAYVRFGDDFIAVINMYTALQINMADLLSVPDDLREVLEHCLGEDASPEVLANYYPSVKLIIGNLLKGLKEKQAMYRKKAQGRRSEDGSDDRRARKEGHRTRLSRTETDSARSSGEMPRRKEPTPRSVSAPAPNDVVGKQRQPPPSSDFMRSNNSPSITPDDLPVTPPAVPANVRRYSLVDKPVPPPSPPVEEYTYPQIQEIPPSSPPPASPPAQPAPAIANSLAALQNDVLSRRASKRYSSYVTSKMTGHPSIRSRPQQSRLATSSNLTQGDLAVLTEAEDENAVPQPGESLSQPARSPVKSSPRSLPSPPETFHQPPHLNGTLVTHPALTTPPPPTSTKISAFLKVGREVKKVTMDPGFSFASLRVLFMDKFSYNPGLENFPAIYIRDPSSGVEYELENGDEVREGCLLSLNIEPLDQIKQHMDTQMSSLSQDVKELKTIISGINKNIASLPISTPADVTLAPRPSEEQFHRLARRLSQHVTQAHPPSSTIEPQATGQSLQPQMTGRSDYTNRAVTNLKTQFDEVQHLRRDLGVMRQLYTEFMKQTKESLGTLREQTHTVKQIASTGVGGARAYIDAGKQSLDTRSQSALTMIEKLQDTFEILKDDVLKRHMTPKPLVFKDLKKDIDTAAAELKILKEQVETVKPMWKKTWAEELQGVVEEQRFLTHEEELLADLLEDHKAVAEVYGHLEKVISLRGPGSGRTPRTRAFKPLSPEVDQSSGLSNVMLEIRGANVDPDHRMKAIEASRQAREKERSHGPQDDLHVELTDFVGSKKLKMTGGAEEAERVRQRRNETTMKAMFAIQNGASEHPSQVSA
ncbi:actin interacting protein 3-domain-containing protein [Infundibulicybe gibba]|nr:actin interacting protein 3-domain-containing protein [Infundibulicybe gibba]